VPLADARDRRPTATAPAPGAAVHVHGSRGASVAGRRDTLRPALGRGVGEEQTPSRRDETAERVVVHVPDRDERRDALDPEELALVYVADTGEGALVEQRLGDREPCSRGVAQPADRLTGVEIDAQQVRPELSERRMERLGAQLEELDDRGIESHGHGTRDLDDEAGARRRAAPSLAWSVAVP